MGRLYKRGKYKRLNEMGITDIDKIYEANELASGENVVFAGSGITDGLLFDGVKFEKIAPEQAVLLLVHLIRQQDLPIRFTSKMVLKHLLEVNLSK